MHMVFLTNVDTQTKRLYLEMVTIYVSFEGWASAKARILLQLGLKLVGPPLF